MPTSVLQKCLDPLTASDCRGSSLVEAAWRNDLKLGALADLELLDPQGDWDRYRLAILGLESSGGSTIDDADLSIFPQELAVFTDDESASSSEDVIVIWYYRADSADTWAVATVPSSTTIEPGVGVNTFVRTGDALPPGEYRADIYLDGTRTVAIEGAEYDPPEERHRAGVVPARRQRGGSRRLGCRAG